LYKIEATIPVAPGSHHNWKIYGKWTEGLIGYNEETEEEIELWKANELPENTDWMYHMTKYALDLNNLPENFKEYLPPTDSRLRPD